MTAWLWRGLAWALLNAGLLWIYYAPATKILVGDEFDYNQRALALLAGKPMPELFIWPPGQTWFIASIYRVFGPHVLAVQLVQIAMLALCAVLLVRLWKTLDNGRCGVRGRRPVPAQPGHPGLRALAVARGHPSGLPARCAGLAADRASVAAPARVPGRAADRTGPAFQEPARRTLAVSSSCSSCAAAERRILLALDRRRWRLPPACCWHVSRPCGRARSKPDAR